jgi:hypothetical protein
LQAACFYFCFIRTDSPSGPHGQSVRWRVLHNLSRVHAVLDRSCLDPLNQLVFVAARSRTVREAWSNGLYG